MSLLTQNINIPAFLISLARRPDRRAAFLNRNAAILPLLDLSIVDAEDGSALELSPSLVSRIDPWNLENLTERELRGCLGCGLSHLRCLDLIAASDKPWGMIFEDDAVFFRPDSPRLLKGLLGRLPDSDLIWLTNWARGASPMSRYLTGATTVISPVMWRPLLSRWDAKFEKTTEAYLISAPYAKRVAELYRNHLGAFDEHIRSYTGTLNGRIFYCRPALFKQANREDSDIH
jgi:GR25 family glycosyltransferase involved in LPS biosynthesis